MYKMGKKEIVLDDNTKTYDEHDNTIYSVGSYKIKLFSSLGDSISERNCLRLAEVKTKRIILPSYPIYHDDQYCGCAYELFADDWIDAFFGKSEYLKESLILMKEEIMMLSQLGVDFSEMKSYQSIGNFSRLDFYGTDRIQDSDMPMQQTIQKNLALFHEYLRNLVYNGMSEFNINSEYVDEYLKSSDPITRTLEEVLRFDGFAGELIEQDIKRKVKI